ncbi:hypothetical protein [Thioalkalivibrio sp. ALgr3]|uniref:hypothetical protein n=1 Tax=Thioalkalivibrio sp. ALgr3 TaxID=1239292 RepID=UPI0003693271|nr:hypothetical protein [Thioalkalivibrio sp. ALgr3]
MLTFGLIDDTVQDTTPGSGCLLAPPAGFAGSDEDYRKIMREQFQNPAGRQRIVLLVGNRSPRLLKPEVVISGPYEHPAREILSSIRSWLAGSDERFQTPHSREDRAA